MLQATNRLALTTSRQPAGGPVWTGAWSLPPTQKGILVLDAPIGNEAFVQQELRNKRDVQDEHSAAPRPCLTCGPRGFCCFFAVPPEPTTSCACSRRAQQPALRKVTMRQCKPAWPPFFCHRCQANPSVNRNGEAQPGADVQPGRALLGAARRERYAMRVPYRRDASTTAKGTAILEDSAAGLEEFFVSLFLFAINPTPLTTKP